MQVDNLTPEQLKEIRLDTIRKSKEVNLLNSPNFKIIIEEAPFITMFSQEFAVPGISCPPAATANPFAMRPLQGDMIEYSDLNISFIVDENLQNYMEIYKWMCHMGFPQAFSQFGRMYRGKTPYKQFGRSDITVAILNNKSNYIDAVKFVEAHPTSLGSIDFTHTSQGIVHQTCSVSFAYTYFTFIESDDTKGE